MDNKYSIEDAVKIVELSTEFGEEMQGLKRGGLVTERKFRIEGLFRRMIPYRDIFNPFLENYVLNNREINKYSRIFKFKVPEE